MKKEIEKTNTMAVIAFVFSVAGLFVSSILLVIGLVLGLVSKKEIEKSGENGIEFAQIAIIISSITIAIILFALSVAN